MSQSDYIKYKKTKTELKDKNKFPSVLSSNNHINYKQYNLENAITNNKITYNKLAPTNKQIVFDIEIPTIHDKTYTYYKIVVTKNTTGKTLLTGFFCSRTYNEYNPMFLRM